MDNEIRVKIDENVQKRLFTNFISGFKNKKDAGNYLKITKYNLYDYSNCKTKYIPFGVLKKISKKLNFSNIKIIDKKNVETN